MEPTDSLGAANALWTLIRMESKPARADIVAGKYNRDWRIRKLAYDLIRRYQIGTSDLGELFQREPDPGVRVHQALRVTDPHQRASKLIEELRSGAARDVYVRYEAAANLAQCADE